MARVTVEDCVLQIPNRFDLVMMAAQRARALNAGGILTIDRDNDKNPVVALREIAETTISLELLRGDLIRGHQKVGQGGHGDDEVSELMASEHSWVPAGEDRPGDREGAEDGELDLMADGDEDGEEPEFDPEAGDDIGVDPFAAPEGMPEL